MKYYPHAKTLEQKINFLLAYKKRYTRKWYESHINATIAIYNRVYKEYHALYMKELIQRERDEFRTQNAELILELQHAGKLKMS